MDPRTIIFIGKQGGGKGTQAKRIEQLLRETNAPVLHVQTGAAFREYAASDSSFTSRKVKDSLADGHLQPSFLASWLWVNLFINGIATGKEHIIADGFPRRVDQAEALESAFEFYERERVDVVHLIIPDAVAVARLMSRARHDDTESAIQKRLSWYEAEITPVLDFFRTHARYRMHDVDGVDDMDSVGHAIEKALNL